jgi:hypothetical protein
MSMMKALWTWVAVLAVVLAAGLAAFDAALPSILDRVLKMEHLKGNPGCVSADSVDQKQQLSQNSCNYFNCVLAAPREQCRRALSLWFLPLLLLHGVTSNSRIS